MNRSQPVLAAPAVAALAARHDLLADGVISDAEMVKLPRVFPERHHLANKLVTRRHWGFAISNATLVAPIHRSPRLAFDVTGANAGALDFDHHLAATGLGDRELFETVVAWAVCNNRRH
jgi:hypothetical protein